MRRVKGKLERKGEKSINRRMFSEHEVNWPLVCFLLCLMLAPLGLNLTLVKPSSFFFVTFFVTVMGVLFRNYYIAYHA